MRVALVGVATFAYGILLAGSQTALGVCAWILGLCLVAAFALAVLVADESTVVLALLFCSTWGFSTGNWLVGLPGTYWIELLLVPLTMALAGRILVIRRPPLRVSSLIVPLGLLGGYSLALLVSLLVNGLGNLILTEARVICSGIAAYFLTRLAIGRTRSPQFVALFGMICTLSVLVLLGEVAYGTFAEFGWPPPLFATGITIHGYLSVGWCKSNTLAGYLVLFFLVALPFGPDFQTRAWRYLWIVALWGCGLAIAMIASLGSLVGLGGGLAVLLSRVPRTRKRGLAGLVVLMCLVVVLSPLGAVVQRRANAALTSYLAGTASRYEIWGSYWKAFCASPLFGIGIGEAGNPEGFELAPLAYYPHNFVLQLLAEEGLIGAAFFLGFVGWHLRRGLAALKAGYRSLGEWAVLSGGVSAVVAGVVHSLVEPLLLVSLPYQVVFFTLLGVIVEWRRPAPNCTT